MSIDTLKNGLKGSLNTIEACYEQGVTLKCFFLLVVLPIPRGGEMMDTRHFSIAWCD